MVCILLTVLLFWCNEDLLESNILGILVRILSKIYFRRFCLLRDLNPVVFACSGQKKQKFLTHVFNDSSNVVRFSLSIQLPTL